MSRHAAAARLGQALCLTGCVLALTGCAQLPVWRWQVQPSATPLFQAAWGQLSAQRSAALVQRLQGTWGDASGLDERIAQEQMIVGRPLVVGNRARLLQDGAATYQAMFEAIAQAQDHINLESYILDDDAVGERFAELLLARQRAGVQVNLMYDSVGAWGTDPAFFEPLRDAGVQVVEFNPLQPWAALAPWAPNHRDHRKLLVVDGRLAILGGVNISGVYASGSSLRGLRHRPGKASGAETGVQAGGGTGALPALPWRDTDILIEGPAVAEFQRLFLQSWQRQRGPTLAGRNYFPVVPAMGPQVVRAIASSPDDPYSLMYLSLLAALGQAQRQIRITQAYFVPDRQLMRALTTAAARGVQVQLILPGQSDSGLTFHAGRSEYTELLQAGVEVFEMRHVLLHAKTAVIDGLWSCVGSSNLDWRSALDNDEINAVVLGEAFAATLQQAFETDLLASTPITWAQWQQRPLSWRLKEWGARRLARLL